MGPFRFKQFAVHQDRCAMKVGTDGVLLGAWISLEKQPHSILDIGAGTGLIALQLAQRSHSKTIDAVEVDGDAFEQCVANFEASPWADRLFCHHAHFKDFAIEMDASYDLIVSNPPFHTENVESGHAARDRARRQQFMPFKTLVEGTSQLLSENGEFATIVPFQREQELIHLAKAHHLLPYRMIRVRGNPNSPIKRSLLQFSVRPQKLEMDELVIETNRHLYTEEFIALTQDFYLKM